MSKGTAKTKIFPPKEGRSRSITVLIGFAALILAIGIVNIVSFRRAEHHNKVGVAVVHITDKGFEPATLTVKQDTKIIWINAGSNLHRVASNPYPTNDDLKSLKSEILNSGQNFEYTASTVGSFGYHDDQQPTMNAKLIVEEP